MISLPNPSPLAVSLFRQLRSARSLALAASALSCLLAPTFADRIVTQDGRVIDVKKIKPEGEGYRLVFENGEILLTSKAAVKAVEIEGDMSDYVPQNDDEKDKLAQGYVRYKGRWLSKKAYETELEDEHKKSQARTQEMAQHSDFASAWTKTTAHFEIRTDTSPELLAYYADLLENYYSLMDDRFGIKPSPMLKKSKMEVNIYKNRREFHKLNKAGLGGGVAGYFSPADKNLNFYHDYAEPEISDWVCLHECTHLLTFLIDPQFMPQIWINEAVADYFGSAVIEHDKKGKLSIHPGRLQTDRVLTVQQAIKDKNDVKLENLFELSRDEFGAFEYSHAWSFVYFLNQTPKYKKGFDRFFKNLYTLAKGITFEVVNAGDYAGGTGKRVPPAEIRRVLLDSLGVKDTAQLESEWKTFIAEIPIEGPMARFKRGYRAIVQGGMWADDDDPKKRTEKTAANLKAAMDDLDAAIEAGLSEPRAWAARSLGKILAMVTNGRPDFDGAKKDLAKSIELDPLNAGYRFQMGSLLTHDLMGVLNDDEGMQVSGDSGASGLKAVPDAKPFYGLAVELAPENEWYRARYESYLQN